MVIRQFAAAANCGFWPGPGPEVEQGTQGWRPDGFYNARTYRLRKVRRESAGYGLFNDCRLMAQLGGFDCVVANQDPCLYSLAYIDISAKRLATSLGKKRNAKPEVQTVYMGLDTV